MKTYISILAGLVYGLGVVYPNGATASNFPEYDAQVAFGSTEGSKANRGVATPPTLSYVAVAGVPLQANTAGDFQYAMECSEEGNEVLVELDIPQGCRCSHPLGLVAVPVHTPGMHAVDVWLEDTATQLRSEFKVKAFKPYPAGEDPFIVNKNNLVLIANNNKYNNGGYTFVKYEWYKDGHYLASGQNYYASLYGEKVLEFESEYSVRLVSNKGELITTCPQKILDKQPTLGIYPNPAVRGEKITVSLGTPTSPLGTDADGKAGRMRIEFYNLSGVLLRKDYIDGSCGSVQAPSVPGSYVMRIVAMDKNYVNITNIMVN